MFIREIWRYTVKSMRGERLDKTEVLHSGLRHDREVVVVAAATGRLLTARTHPGLLGLQAVAAEDGDTLVDGLSYRSEEAREKVSEACSTPVKLVGMAKRMDRFDVLPLLIATDGAIEELGIDRRRLRPNIVVGDVPGRAERDWEGRSLSLGEVVAGVAQLRMRCVMTTFDPDTLDQDRTVLFRIAREMGGKLALDCSVKRPGPLAVGDAVALTL